MAGVKLPTCVIEALKSVALQNGFKEPTYNFKEVSLKGFIGEIERCEIGEGTRTLPVICKFLPSNDELNAQYNSYELFKREVFIYQKFLPEVTKIQLEHALKYRDSEGFWSFPRCYLSHFNSADPQTSIIIMEDLTVDEFITKDMCTPSDFQHTLAIFEELGKFHAISFALKKLKPEIFAEFKSMDDIMCELMTTPIMQKQIPVKVQLASEVFSQPEDVFKKNKVLSYKTSLWEKTKEIMKASKEEPFAVVCHGDCWINNVMYNYEDGGVKIKDVRLIDWQMTRYGSAATELMYYLFTCNKKHVRNSHQADLIQSYYKAMGAMLKYFRLDLSEIFPFKVLEDHMIKFGGFAFAMAIYAMPLMYKYPERLYDDKNAELTELEQHAVVLYKQTMQDIVNDLIEMNVI